ncbi:hypothetical protein HY256_02450 [Candidatus Sumerlaeota bacterium]|nr:hypothetical protein [Candidatus Sumerlaeota bacterium]
MRIQFTLTGRRQVLKAALILAALPFFIYGLARVIGPRLDGANAEAKIRHFYNWRIHQEHMADLQASGKRVPDRETAIRWDAEVKQAADFEIVSLETARAFGSWFSLFRTNYVAKAVIRRSDGPEETRYIYLHHLGLDRECSRVWWLLSV